MTEVKYFDEPLILADSVVNQNGAMVQFSHAGPFSDRPTHAWKPSQQVHVVKQGPAKTHRGLAIVLGNIADYFSEIA